MVYNGLKSSLQLFANFSRIFFIDKKYVFFFSLKGGIKAVVWTDVVQGVIMLSSVAIVGILGTHKVGGLSKVFEYANQGGRLDTK